MSHLQIRYSESYDASLSGWTGALDAAYFEQDYERWLREYVEPAQQYVAAIQATWDEFNDAIFAALRQFGYQFADLWPAYAVHRWPGVVGFKDPLTFFVGEPPDEALVLLTHELVHCHEDYGPNQAVYERARRHIFERFADEPLAVRYHLLTLGVQGAVLRRVFPERSAEMLPLTCRHPLLQRCALILQQAEWEDSDPLGSLAAL